MSLFPVWRRPPVMRPRHTVFVSCQDGHRAVLPVYRLLAAAVARTLSARGWTVPAEALERRRGPGELTFVHRATSPGGDRYDYSFVVMSDQTTPFAGTTVDVHLVVGALEPVDGHAPDDDAWAAACAALDDAVCTVRKSGQRIWSRA